MAIRTLVVAATTAVCLFVTTFTDFVNIAGAIGCVTVAFVLPELLYYKVFKDRMTKLEKFGCWFLAIFGIAGSVYSLIYSIRKIINGE